MRVHELARELGLRSSKEILDKLGEHGMQLKNHMSPLTDEQVDIVRKAFPHGSVPAGTPPPTARSAVVEKKTILVRGPIIVKEFAEQLGLKPNQLIAELMMMNIFASINERVDLKIAQQLAEKHGAHLEHEKKVIERKPVTKAAEPAVEPTEDRSEDLATRPPIVTFMGHVDHGKTSLLDKIRNTKVAAGEDGGITQHIGAYTVTVHDRQITFLDTPGHAAFTQMRARGANLTDIAVIVIAADDGIMPQTREAIQHAKAAKVTLMIAINKIDLRGANVDRVKQQLQKEGLAPEDWGGEVICCPVSAVTGAGIDHLLEMILLQADMLELKANPSRRAQGYVIEARLEPGMGPTANIIIKRGTLTVGDAITCGPYWGRVKALISDKGIKVRTAAPSTAVKVLGLTAVPEPGMEFQVQANDRVAREMSEKALAEKRLQEMTAVPKRLTLDDLMRPAAAQTKEAHKLRAILKADVQGSLEAIQNALTGIKSDKVQLDMLLAGVGNISSNDVLLARASEAIIIGFHVGKDDGVGAVAKREGVEIRLYSIIYELLDDVRNVMIGLLEPIIKQSVIGHAEVLQVFDLGKKGKAAGCRCTDGRITSRCRSRVKRKGDVLFEGALVSLKRFQNDAAEVREGQECGLRLDHFADFQPGDVVECFEAEKIAQQL